MALPNGFIKTTMLAAVAGGALLIAEPAFAWHGGGGGWHGGGWHGGGWHGGGWRGGGWHGGGWRGGWGRPVWGPGWGGGWGGGVVVAPGWGWGGWGPGWDDGFYAAPVYSAPVYAQCYIRRVRVHTSYGWRWRRVRYCYQ
ncbi:MAG TPA: hypothetical protein VMU18_01065 [Rhodoblastus sp.]|nr:hypothetical protein [Rhodoblastus sp.]